MSADHQRLITEIEVCLRKIFDPNGVSEATVQLNTLLKKAESSLYLLHHIQTSQYKEIRQIAAVLLRKKIAVHWIKLNEANREAISTNILVLFAKETEGVVKKAIAEVMIAIARIELPLEGWSQFLPFLFELSNSQDPLVREIQMHIFDQVLQNMSIDKSHVAAMLVVFKAGLSDPTVRVRSNALRAVGSAIMSLSEEKKMVEKFAELVPHVIDTLKVCIQNNLDQEVISLFEVFDELAENTNSIISYLPQLCRFSLLEVCGTPAIEKSIRTCAMEFIDTVIQYKPKVIKKATLIEPLLQLIFHILIVEAPEGVLDGDEDIDDLNLYQSAGVALRHLGESFSAKLVYDPVLPMLKQFSESADLKHRVGLPLIIQQYSYGCGEEMRDNIEFIIQLVLKGLNDPEKSVRQNACVCIGKLSDNISPDIYKYSSVIFPAIFQSLSDPDDAFVLRCCYAMESFLTNLEVDQLLPILPAVMEKLGLLLTRPNVQVKEFTLSVICAVALTSEMAFEPYFEQLLSLIKELLVLTQPNQIILRANAMDCMGALVKTVPKDRFRPLLDYLINTAQAGVALNHSELSELTFSFYSTVFEHFGEEMDKYLPIVFPTLLKSAISDDGVIQTEVRSDLPEIQGIDNDEAAEDDIEQEEPEMNTSVRTNFLDEKSAAVHCIGVLAYHLPKSFYPLIDKVIQPLEQLCAYFHEDIRFEALLTLQSLMKSVITLHPYPWAKGDFQAPVPEQVQTLVTYSFQIYNHMLTFESKKSVVARAFGCIADTICLVGPAAISSKIAEIGNHVLQVIKGHAYCQTVTNADPDEDDDEDQDDIDEDIEQQDGDEEEDEEESDYNLLHYASECMIEVATVSGPAFKPYIESSIPHLLKLTKKNNHHSIRACVIGTIAEMIKVVKVDFSSQLPVLFNLAIAGLKDESPQVRRTSCFLLGVLMLNCVSATKQHFMSVLEGVVALINNDKEQIEVKDNVLGCVARLISSGSHHIPLEHVLPLFISKLPVKDDCEEIGSSFDAIFLLYSIKFDMISPYTSQILTIFASDLSQKRLDIETRNKIKSLVVLLAEKFGQQMEILINQLPADKKNIILTCLQK